MRCGPAVLQYIARRCLARDLSDEEADTICFLGSDGTSPEGMRSGFNSLGLNRVEVLRNTDLMTVQTHIDNGAIVAVCYLEGGTHSGHWGAMHHAYHPDNGDSVFIWDKDAGYREIPVDYWMVHWLDYSVIDSSWVLYRRTAVVGYPPNPCKPVT